MKKALLCLFLINWFSGYSQKTVQLPVNTITSNADAYRIDENTGQISYIRFKGADMQPISSLQQVLDKLFGPGYEYREINHSSDELGFTHRRLMQVMNGIPVTHSMIIVHELSGKIVSVNGDFYPVDKLPSSPSLSKNNAIEKAMFYAPSTLYKHNQRGEDSLLKINTGNPQASYLPDPELVYINKDFFTYPLDMRLAYRVRLYSVEPLFNDDIFIDALTGELLGKSPQIHHSNVPGKFVTKYSGTKFGNTDSIAPGNYRLRETVRGNGIETYNLKKGTSYGAAVDFTDADNTWNNVNGNKDEVATDAHWGAEMTYDYYKSVHGRLSFDNNNAKIKSYVHYSNAYNNAFWDGVEMTYGDGDGTTFTPLTALDVCGHEITHAVTSYTANLIYSYESGQLNESFSDIFGQTIEIWARPTQWDWKIGEDITPSFNGIRRMSNPNSNGQPDTYLGTFWYSGAGDNGGVHYNSGVQNFWYYLLVAGGTGTNDIGNAYKVDSIALKKAEKIAYRNLSVYLTPSSKHKDARFYSIIAATDLYGNCSKEVISTTNAWYAVGVGAKYDSGYVKADFYADTLVCNSATLVKFTNLSTNSKKAYWTFGDSKKDSSYNTSHVYPGYGSYTVKLKAISCFKNISDSITKTAYVRIDSMHDICNSTLMPANKIDTVNKCQGFVYDRGGEGYYYNLETGTLVISPTNADSISVWFKVFDYEAGYDFLSLYNGPNTGSPLIGTYTGTSLPKGGLRIVATSGKLTIKHTSDQMVTGQGFKFYFTAHRKLPKIKAFKDTSICYGTSAKITAVLSQGVSPDITYTWDKGLGTGNVKTVQPIADTKYRVIAFDQCLKVRDTAYITVKVRKPLKIKVPRDTTFCYGIKYNLIAKGTGGDSLKYAFKWSDGNLKDTNKITTSVTTKYRIILSDGCSVKNDTGYVNIKVLKALTVKANGGDSICKGSQIKLFATPKGGDSSKYSFFWTPGAPPTDTVRVNPLLSGWYKITLSDNCSAKPANDSTYVTIFSSLALTLTPKDTTICYGTGLNISAKIKGGDKKTYKFGWVPGVPLSYNDFVIPAKTTYYRFTASDKCNVPVKDSIHIVVRKPVKMTLTKDTTICFGRDVILNASATGGDSTKYVFRWDNGLPNGSSNKVMPNSSTFYRASVYDGCSAFGDSLQVTVFVLNPISVSLSNDTIICNNGAARIIATTNGGNVKQYKFTWTPAAANNDTIFVSPANNTTYKLNLTDGCSIATATDTVRVNVYNKLKATVLNNDTTLCFGNSIDLSSTNSGGDIATITKDWNKGLSSSNNFNTKPTGTKIYKFTVTDKCAQPVFDSVIVKVLNPLSLHASKDTLICNGGVADIFAKAKGGDVKNYNFAWDNSLPNDSMNKVNPSVTTTYNVILTDGCTPTSASAKIKVSVLAPLSVNAGNDTAVCTGQAIKLIASAKGGKNLNRTITWNPGNVNNDTLRNIPVISGYYIAEVTDGCSTPDMDSLFVTVNVLPVADFTVNTILACTPASIQFTNKSTPTGSIYKWRFGDGDFSADTDPLHDYLDKGLYIPRLTVETAQGCVDTLDFATNIEILQQPVASFIADKPTTEIDDALISFTNQSQDADRYEWTFGDTNTIFTGVNELHRYLDTGYYNVILKVFNKANCTDQDTMWIRINDIFRIFIPDAFSPNNDGHNDAFGSVMTALTTFNMEVYDRWGMKVFESNDYKKQWDGKIKDADAQTDIYVVKYTVSTLDGHTYYFKKAVTLLR